MLNLMTLYFHIIFTLVTTLHSRDYHDSPDNPVLLDTGDSSILPSLETSFCAAQQMTLTFLKTNVRGVSVNIV